MAKKNFARGCLIVFNFFALIIGLAILGLGAYVQVKGQEAFDFLTEAANELGDGAKDMTSAIPTEAIDSIVIGVLVLGGFVFLVSVLGFIGAQRNSRLLLLFYIMLMTLLSVIQLGLAVGILIVAGLVQSPGGDVERYIGALYHKLPEQFTQQFGYGTRGVRALRDYLAANFQSVGIACCVVCFVMVVVLGCGCAARGKIDG